MEETIVVKNLRYNFSDAELKVLSRELALKFEESEKAEREKKLVAAQIKAESERISSEASDLSRKIRNEYEFREVRCRVELNNPSDGLKTFFRCDNGESVESAPMEAWEYQQSLDLEDADEAEKPAEEKVDDGDPNTGCVSCNNLLPFEDAAKTAHANGAKCTRQGGAGAVASAVEAAGGTTDALRKGRGRPRREAAPVAAPTAEERAKLDEMAEAQQVN